jgi:hypothetical protein
VHNASVEVANKDDDETLLEKIEDGLEVIIKEVGEGIEEAADAVAAHPELIAQYVLTNCSLTRFQFYALHVRVLMGKGDY